MRYRNKISIIALLLCMIVGIAVAENVKDGTGALGSVTTGDDNVAIGSYSLQSLTTGHGNTAFGAYAGRSTVTANGSVYLGYGAGLTNTSAHKLFINTMFYPSNGIFADFSTGYHGLNNSAPTVALDVTGALTASGISTGAAFSLSANGTAAAPVLYRSTDTDTGLYWLTNTGNRLGFTAKGVAVAIADSAGVMAIPALSVRMEKASDLTDSSFTVTLPSGVPTISLFGTDDDTYTISINTSDQALISGASAVVTDTLNVTNVAATGYSIVNGAMIGRSTLDVTGAITLSDRVVMSDTLFVSKEQTVVGADSSFYATVASGNPFLGFRATDGDLTNITVYTTDQLSFEGASGGYIFDAEGGFGTGSPVVNTVTIGSTNSSGLLITMEKSPAGTDSSVTIKMSSGSPTINMFATDGDTYTIGINTSDQETHTGAADYLFDNTIRVKPTAPASNDSLLVLRNSLGNTVASIDSAGKLDVAVDPVVAGTTAWIDSTNITDDGIGNEDIRINSITTTEIRDSTIDSTDVKNASLSVSDIANGANGFLPKIQTVYTIDADSTIGAGQSGTLFVSRPLAAKRTITLPTASAGLTYDFMVADTDSLLIASATDDSLITSAGAAWKTTSSVAGTVKLVAIDTVRWIMQYTLGTWTSY